MVLSNLIRLYALFFSISFAISFSAKSQDGKNVYNKTHNSTVTIETNYSIGSGFFIANDIIATNYHVVEDATDIYCYPSNSSKKYKIVEVINLDKEADLALLKVVGLTRSPVKFSTKSVSPGEKIFVIGSPKGLPATVSDGIVSGLRNFEGRSLIQITAPISSGSSGGPVFNMAGELIGISVSQIDGGQNLNFAIPATDLQNLVNEKRVSARPKSQLPPKVASSGKGIKETQDWIKEKIEGFSHYSKEIEANIVYKVEFRECSMIVNMILEDGKLTSEHISEIPLSKLSKVYFLEDQLFRFHLKIKTNDPIIKHTYKFSSPPQPTKTEISLKREHVFDIDKFLIRDNLAERLTTAFNHLMALCGATTAKEIF